MKENRAGPLGKGSEAKENEGQVKLTNLTQQIDASTFLTQTAGQEANYQ